MNDHSAHPRIESTGTFVLTVDTPCDYEEDCGCTTPARESGLSMEVIDTWSVTDGGAVEITRDITSDEMSTPEDTYWLLVTSAGIGAVAGLSSVASSIDYPDPFDVSRIDPDYLFASGDPAYEQEFGSILELNTRGDGAHFPGSIQAACAMLLTYPVDAGTLIGPCITGHSWHQTTVHLIKGGKAVSPNYLSEVQGGISTDGTGGVFSHDSGAGAQPWSGDMGNDSTWEDYGGLFLIYGAASLGKASNCGLTNFGDTGDGSLVDVVGVTVVGGAERVKDIAVTSYPLIPPCIGSPDTMNVQSAIWAVALPDGTGTVNPMDDNDAPAYGDEAGYYQFTRASSCGAPSVRDLEAGWVEHGL